MAIAAAVKILLILLNFFSFSLPNYLLHSKEGTAITGSKLTCLQMILERRAEYMLVRSRVSINI
jgi:hypothetical protein